MKSLLKSLDVLELFLKGADELALAEIASLSNIHKTSVSRIVSSLVSRGYLKQKEKRGKYSLGTIYFEYTGLIKSRTRLRATAIPHLVQLSQSVNESVIIAYKSGFDSIENVYTETFHEKSAPNTLLKVSPDEGMSLSLHSTSLGKVLLASLSEQGLQRYIDSHPLRNFTANTVTEPAELKKQLAQVRQNGVAYDNEEYSLGVKGVAAGIRNGDGNTVGAIGILAPTVRTDTSRMKQLTPIVKTVADSISREAGYAAQSLRVV